MLTFLCSDSGQDDKYYLRLGLMSAAKACGFNFHIYDERVTPVYDAVHDFKPDIILSTYSDHTLAQRKAIEKHNLKFYSLDCTQYAFDNINFKPGKPQDYLKCDVARVGPPIKDLFNFLPGDLSYRFFGGQSYSCPQYMGRVDLEDQADIFASAKTVIVADMEQFYQVAGCGGLPLLIGETGSFGFYYANARSLREVQGIVQIVTSDSFDGEGYKKILRDYIMNSHTYFHKLAEILDMLDFEDEAGEVYNASTRL